MSPGLYGADIAQLRSLSKSIGQSGSRLLSVESTVNGIVGSSLWKGADGDRFRNEWTSSLRPMLHTAADSLRSQARQLLTEADQQETASGGGSSGGPGGIPGTPSSPGTPGQTPAGTDDPNNPFLDIHNNTAYQVLNTAAAGGGFISDVLLSQMSKAGLLAKGSWSLLGAQYGQMPGVGYVNGTRLLNGLSMVGRAAGVLSVLGGGIQMVDGIMSGDAYAATDGGVTAVLAAGSFIPGVGLGFAAAGLVWAGAGFLAKGLGYDSTSEMVVDGAKKVGGAIADGANAVADGAKKVWGWLGG
ncbi:hypothetical protein PSET11_01986 [Arthrobacter ulcerisalmonis]|uniref:WXG100 family type VII secretion target n=1 Tax=Arthrobacter ulcerisalmonis TaxID=2483813 RepID=A0A3P5XGQ0_9MICC|nr:hypothetical protein [Arthrobacter ulcerisalmonis]VDC27674.1 hypothetical protein PSET11_01986 [Arthrobacter ulcerisalmonis]